MMPRPPTNARRGRERGAALLVAMIGIAVLTALAVDLAYESRVSLRIAANGRDQLRASYLARSGVAMSRLVLSFQQNIDELPATAGPIPIPRVNLWRLVPVGSALVEGLFPGSAPPSAAASNGAGPEKFEADISDEAIKVNVQLEPLAGGADRKLWSQVVALYQLICDPRWDSLFEREDAHGIRTSREDLLVHLRDWVDEGDRTSGLLAAFGGASCAMIPAAKVFEDAFGDENQPYDRGDDRYRTKNHHMDSIDELYLVAGIGDAFMAAFGDMLTAYLPREAKRSINLSNPDDLLQLAREVADPPMQPALFDPVFAQQLHALVAARTVNGLLAISQTELGQAIVAAGVTVTPSFLQASAQNNPFTDRSTTFRIRSNGTSGDVKTTIDAVVRLVKVQQGQPVAAPGKLIHWREE